MKPKLVKVYLVNVQTLHAMCGFGTGRTQEEAKEKALAKARERDTNAYYDRGQVFFNGGVNC